MVGNDFKVYVFPDEYIITVIRLQILRAKTWKLQGRPSLNGGSVFPHTSQLYTIRELETFRNAESYL